MAMKIELSGQEENVVMAEINTTPLVDIMLVLLIIFLITIPIITKTVPVKLPKAVNIATTNYPEKLDRRIVSRRSSRSSRSSPF
jgi:biopolymer transport protein ExbD